MHILLCIVFHVVVLYTHADHGTLAGIELILLDVLEVSVEGIDAFHAQLVATLERSFKGSPVLVVSGGGLKYSITPNALACALLTVPVRGAKIKV